MKILNSLAQPTLCLTLFLFCIVILVFPQFLYCDDLRLAGKIEFAYKLDYPCFSEIEVSAALKNTSSFLELDYTASDEPIRGLFIDLDNDGKTELFLQSSKSECGTGGCIYALYQGSKNRTIGMFFGNPIFVTSKKINGFPILCLYAHSSATSGSWSCYVFDNRVYTKVDEVLVSGESLDKLSEGWNSIPLKCKSD